MPEDSDLNAFHLRNSIYYGRHEDGRILEKRVQRQPRGNMSYGRIYRRHVLSSTTHANGICRWRPRFAFTVRPWLQHFRIGERYGMLRRVVNRYNHQVNGYFLCDRGRFGYEFVESSARIRNPLVDGKAATKSRGAGTVWHNPSREQCNRHRVAAGVPRVELCLACIGWRGAVCTQEYRTVNSNC